MGYSFGQEVAQKKHQQIKTDEIGTEILPDITGCCYVCHDYGSSEHPSHFFEGDEGVDEGVVIFSYFSKGLSDHTTYLLIKII